MKMIQLSKKPTDNRIMHFFLSTVLIFHFCQCCEIEWSDSKLPLVTEADIQDFDGKFTVSWAHLVKHPLCAASIMVTVNYRTAVIKRCSNCENGRGENHGSAKYIGPITVSLKADSESVCDVTLIEVFITDFDGVTKFTKMEINPAGWQNL